MKAVQFLVSVPRYAFGLVAGRITPSAYVSTLSCVQYREVPEPHPIGPEWVKIRTRYGGICGSDVNVVRLHDSPALSPFAAKAFTLGHEQVGTIVETGGSSSGFRPGQRVVADPVLPCPTRHDGKNCPHCRAGEWSRCEEFAEGNLCGLEIGSCADTGGSWSPLYLAHAFQLFAVPDNVSDENAILVDTLCSALHPVMRSLPKDSDTVLVCGAGVIGICAVASLRALGSKARILVLARYPFQAEMARHYGATEVILARGQDHYERVAELTGARLYRPALGKRVMVGGADVVYECVGTDESVDDALRFTRGGGRLALVGLVGRTRNVDWTMAWFKELTIQGNLASCSAEVWQGRRVRPYELALEWLAEGRIDLSPLLTHTFALADYRRALVMNMHKSRHNMLKAAFAFD